MKKLYAPSVKKLLTSILTWFFVALLSMNRSVASGSTGWDLDQPSVRPSTELLVGPPEAEERIRITGYQPGQIKIHGSAAAELMSRVFSAGANGFVNSEGIVSLRVVGLADKIDINDRIEIWRRLPFEIRPQRVAQVNNTHIAMGRAHEVSSLLAAAGLSGAVNLKVVTGLPASKNNRGVEIFLVRSKNEQ